MLRRCLGLSIQDSKPLLLEPATLAYAVQAYGDQGVPVWYMPFRLAIGLVDAGSAIHSNILECVTEHAVEARLLHEATVGRYQEAVQASFGNAENDLLAISMVLEEYRLVGEWVGDTLRGLQAAHSVPVEFGGLMRALEARQRESEELTEMVMSLVDLPLKEAQNRLSTAASPLHSSQGRSRDRDDAAERWKQYLRLGDRLFREVYAASSRRYDAMGWRRSYLDGDPLIDRGQAYTHRQKRKVPSLYELWILVELLLRMRALGVGEVVQHSILSGWSRRPLLTVGDRWDCYYNPDGRSRCFSGHALFRNLRPDWYVYDRCRGDRGLLIDAKHYNRPRTEALRAVMGYMWNFDVTCACVAFSCELKPKAWPGATGDSRCLILRTERNGRPSVMAGVAAIPQEAEQSQNERAMDRLVGLLVS